MYLECTIKTQLHTTVDKYNKVSLKKCTILTWTITFHSL
jgi:hypothetical protein